MRRIAAVAAVLILAACDSASPAASPQTSAPASAAAAQSLPTCAADVPSRVLPEWARAGFSEANPSMPHVLGDRGDIVAIIFGYPLYAPTLPDRSNKILWVSGVPQEPGEPLEIDARLDGTGDPVTREVAGGAGPSIIDLPAAGCWHLRLTWSGHTDTMRLTYQKK
jgi:hypothetical protein